MSSTITLTENPEEISERHDEIRITENIEDAVREADLVIFDDCSKGLGIKICGGYNEETETDFGIFIKRVLPGGLADIQGGLKDGDQILAVNTESVEGVTNERAVAILRKASASSHVEMVVTRDEQARSEFLKVLEKQNGYSHSCTPISTEVHSKASSRATTPLPQGTDGQKKSQESESSPRAHSSQSSSNNSTEQTVLDFDDDSEHVVPHSMEVNPSYLFSKRTTPQQFIGSRMVPSMTSTPHFRGSDIGLITETAYEPSPVSNGSSSSQTIQQDAAVFNSDTFPSVSTPRSLAHSRKLSLDPHVRLKIDKLEVALQYLGIEPTPEQQVALRERLKVDPAGMVVYGDFVSAAREIFRVDLEQRNISTGAMYYATNDLKHILEPPPFVSDNDFQKENSIPNKQEDFESVKRERDELRLELKRVNALLKEQDSSCHGTEEELLIIRKEAQKAIDETRSLRCKVHLSEEAQRAARGMEQDYEDVVRLLEQEIASLKHQMAKQIENNPVNQKRLAVLTCQLRKAEAGKKTYEVATEKLLRFAEQVHEMMTAQENGLGIRQAGNEGAAARGSRPPGFLAKHKRYTPKALATEAKDVVKSVKIFLEADTLPFGWEEAYTADGMKYYINHMTQTTTWSHPMSNVQHLPKVHSRKPKPENSAPP